MAFYGERFQRPDEEDIWEELRQMLINSDTLEAQKKLQETREIEAFNKAWDRANGVGVETTSQAEPYLNYEDLFPQEKTKGQLTSMAMPLKQHSNNNFSPNKNQPQNNFGKLTSTPLNLLNKNPLEGFGQNSMNGFANKKEKNQFPDLGKTSGYKNEGFAPVYDEEEMLKNYLVNPNQNIVFDEANESITKKKKKQKNETEEPVTSYEEMSEESEETFSEFQEEPYLRYEDLLPEETDEEREARETRELEAFNKAWDEANGVIIKNDNSNNGVLTSGVTELEKTPLLEGHIEKINKDNLTLGEKILDKILQNKITTRGHYPVAADMYTDARTDFSRARNNKNATVLENMDSLDLKTIDALIKYGVKPDERGVYYNSDSNVSKKFGKSRELKKAFDKNLEDIKKGEFNSDNLNFDAKLIDAIINKDRFDRNSSIQHAKLNKAYYDEQGRKHAQVIDRLDYNKRSDDTLKNKIKNYPNNHGYSLQEKGELENYFTVMDVIIEDDDWLDKLRKKLGL